MIRESSAREKSAKVVLSSHSQSTHTFCGIQQVTSSPTKARILDHLRIISGIGICNRRPDILRWHRIGLRSSGKTERLDAMFQEPRFRRGAWTGTRLIDRGRRGKDDWRGAYHPCRTSARARTVVLLTLFVSYQNSRLEEWKREQERDRERRREEREEEEYQERLERRQQERDRDGN